MSKESSKEVFYIIVRADTEDEWTTVEEDAAEVLQYMDNDDNYAPVRVFVATVGSEVTIERKVTVKVKPVGK